MIDLAGLLIQLASGAFGGTLTGDLFKAHSLGRLGNLVSGMIGGSIGGQIIATVLKANGGAVGGFDPGSIVSQIAGAGVGGGALVLGVTLILRCFDRPSDT